MIVVCPPADEAPWPTLGRQVCDFIEAYLCHGPGDLLGAPVKLTPEVRAWLYRMYEVEPQFIERRKNGVIARDKNPRAGKRRFTRCAISVRKGYSKTELAAQVAATELHPDGPVRCVGWSDNGEPIGGGVTDPYIPMVSSTEEQTEELAYGALRRILEEAPSGIGRDFDIGLERIVRLDGNGKAEAVSGSPNARDGARTTFQHADETHRFTSESIKRAWTVMLNNLAKRPHADPWALETTTAYEPGAQSVAEGTDKYARKLLEAPHPDKSKLFFFHRQADDGIDVTSHASLRKAVIEASGPFVSKWTDVDRIVGTFFEPDADLAYQERVWLNRPTQSSGIAFSQKRWRELSSSYNPPNGSAITLGFHGARYDDAAAVIATHVDSGFQWPLGVWEHNPEIPDWEVPADELTGIIADAFTRYRVCRMYAEPDKWESLIAIWAGTYRDKKHRVYNWEINRRKAMGEAVRAYASAMTSGDLSHDTDAVFERHIGNARKVETGLTDENGKPLWVIRKERPGAPINGAIAAVLSWEARNDALAAGENIAEPEPEYDLIFL